MVNVKTASREKHLWVNAEVGESGQTVNLLFRLSRFDSYFTHHAPIA